MLNAYIADKLYVPAVGLNLRHIEQQYIKSYYSEYGCNKCEYKPERPARCSGCEHYGGTFRMACTRRIQGERHVGFPLGEYSFLGNVGIDVTKYNWVDMSTYNPMDVKLKFKPVNEPYDYQEECSDKLTTINNGVIVMPPRSGKSLTSVMAVLKIGQKAIYIADQYDFLEQIIRDFERDTNLIEMERKVGYKLVDFVKKPEDLEYLQVAFITYQSLLSERGLEMLNAINRWAGCVFVDEAHSAATPCYSDVLNSLRSAYRFGMTGTDRRKDGKYEIVEMMFGDVAFRLEKERMRAKLVITQTSHYASNGAFFGIRGYQKLSKNLALCNARNDFIVAAACEDIRRGHVVLITVLLKEHVQYLVEGINNRLGVNVAAGFTGGGGSKAVKQYRTNVKDQANAGRVKAIIAIRGLARRGLTIGPLSALYYVIPQDNEPNWEQETARILTPYKDKRQPIIRFFADVKCPKSLEYMGENWNYSLDYGFEPTPKAQETHRALFKKSKQPTTSALAPSSIFGALATSLTVDM